MWAEKDHPMHTQLARVKVLGKRQTDMVAKGAELRKEQQSERDKLQGDIDQAKSNEVSECYFVIVVKKFF